MSSGVWDEALPSEARTRCPLCLSPDCDIYVSLWGLPSHFQEPQRQHATPLKECALLYGTAYPVGEWQRTISNCERCNITAEIGGQFNQYLDDDGLDDLLWTSSLASSEFDDESFSFSAMCDDLLATFFEDTITWLRSFASTKAWYVKSEVDLDPAVIDSISQQRSVALAAHSALPILMWTWDTTSEDYRPKPA